MGLYIYDFFFKLETPDQQHLQKEKVATKASEHEEQPSLKKMRADRSDRPALGDGQGGNDNVEAEYSKRGSYKGFQARLDTWPALRKNGSAPGKLFTTPRMAAHSKHQGESVEGMAKKGLGQQETHPDEEAIPTATYEPINDLEKGDSDEDSDDYANQVRGIFNGDSGTFRGNESQWRMEHDVEVGKGNISHTIFENTKLYSSSFKISEIQSEVATSLEACSAKTDNSSMVSHETKSSSENVDVVTNKASAEVQDFNVLELRNPCDIMRKMREKRTSERLQQNMIDAIFKNQDNSSKKRSVEGNSSPTSNAFSSLDDDAIASVSLNLGVPINDKHFVSLNILRDLELARGAINNRQ